MSCPSTTNLSAEWQCCYEISLQSKQLLKKWKVNKPTGRINRKYSHVIEGGFKKFKTAVILNCILNIFCGLPGKDKSITKNCYNIKLIPKTRIIKQEL